MAFVKEWPYLRGLRKQPRGVAFYNAIGTTVDNLDMYLVFVLGAPNIGRRSLKTRLFNEWRHKFGEVKAREYTHLCVV